MHDMVLLSMVLLTRFRKVRCIRGGQLFAVSVEDLESARFSGAGVEDPHLSRVLFGVLRRLLHQLELRRSSRRLAFGLCKVLLVSFYPTPERSEQLTPCTRPTSCCLVCPWPWLNL
jgi:hypothetical protein